MKITQTRLLLLTLMLAFFSSNSFADSIGTIPASCFKFSDHAEGRVLTWHSPFVHADPSDYSTIGVKMKVTGSIVRESEWFEASTYSNYSSYVAWQFYSKGIVPLAVFGTHRAKLQLTGANVGITPTTARCI